MKRLRVALHFYDLDGKFELALDMYSEAIFCKVSKKQKAIYYCNRALVNLKLENNAIALFGNFYPKNLFNLFNFLFLPPSLSLNVLDAKDSIKCDETFAKAYFRRGQAYVALG